MCLDRKKVVFSDIVLVLISLFPWTGLRGILCMRHLPAWAKGGEQFALLYSECDPAPLVKALWWEKGT